MTIRPADEHDLPRILELNAAVEELTSPLNPARLAQLHAWSTYHRVVEIDGSVSAFALIFAQGSDYDSGNYAWFAQRFAQFLYIDRIVVDSARRGAGVGRKLYEDLFAYALANGNPPIGCEYNAEPLNVTSQRFHDALGFNETGRQWVTDAKCLSYQLRQPPGAAG